MVATTSAAVSAWPSWNLTPGRSAKVQTLPSSLGFHDSASIGLRVRSGLSRTRNSPVCISISRPPVLATVTGSTAPDGACAATRMVVPALPWARAGGLATPDSAASSGAARPTRAPWRSRLRRSMRPARNSSTTWLPIGPACRRRRSSKVGRIIGMLPYRSSMGQQCAGGGKRNPRRAQACAPRRRRAAAQYQSTKRSTSDSDCSE